VSAQLLAELQRAGYVRMATYCRLTPAGTLWLCWDFIDAGSYTLLYGARVWSHNLLVGMLLASMVIEDVSRVELLVGGHGVVSSMMFAAHDILLSQPLDQYGWCRYGQWLCRDTCTIMLPAPLRLR
jgi:hypothetical protein